MTARTSWSRAQVAAATVATFAALVAGCGGPANVGTVSGVVTLDGQPLPDARVTFQPRQGAPSLGVTDASGRYELRYTRDRAGAVVGEHAVSISTFRAGRPDADPPVERRPERVPPRYNRQTELNATVDRGANQIDFSLDGSGKFAQPKPGDY